VPRAQVAHLKRQGPRLVDVTRRLSGLDIEVVHRVGVERLGALAGQDVRQTRWVGEAEDAPSEAVSAITVW
jgi:hypothetical protein